MKKVLALLGLLLAGCATPAQEAATDNQQCGSYGFTAGSPAFAQCRMNLDMQLKQARIAAGNAFADGLDAASYNYSHPVAPPAMYQPPSMLPACAEGYACAGRTLQGDGAWH